MIGATLKQFQSRPTRAGTLEINTRSKLTLYCGDICLPLNLKNAKSIGRGGRGQHDLPVQMSALKPTVGILDGGQGKSAVDTWLEDAAGVGIANIG